MTKALIRTEIPPLVLRMHPALKMDDRQFFEFCQQNPDLRIECTAEGDLEIMPPTGWESSNQNATLTHLVTAWALGDGTGAVSDSSGGFILPNGERVHESFGLGFLAEQRGLDVERVAQRVLRTWWHGLGVVFVDGVARSVYVHVEADVEEVLVDRGVEPVGV